MADLGLSLRMSDDEIVEKVAKRLEYLNPIDPQPGDLFLDEQQRRDVARAAIMAYVQIETARPLGKALLGDGVLLSDLGIE